MAALALGDKVAPDLWLSAIDALRFMEKGPRRPRLARARLAIALRVLLRADAMEPDGAPGGYEWRTCGRCYGAGEVALVEHDDTCPRCDGMGLLPSPICVRPLWLDAPPHRGAS
jgi:hypothetical protein